jgi:hypothetical protein
MMSYLLTRTNVFIKVIKLSREWVIYSLFSPSASIFCKSHILRFIEMPFKLLYRLALPFICQRARVRHILFLLNLLNVLIEYWLWMNGWQKFSAKKWILNTFATFYFYVIFDVSQITRLFLIDNIYRKVIEFLWFPSSLVRFLSSC